MAKADIRLEEHFRSQSPKQREGNLQEAVECYFRLLEEAGPPTGAILPPQTRGEEE